MFGLSERLFGCIVQVRPSFSLKLQPPLFCSDICCLRANTVLCQSWNITVGVDCVHDMQEQLKKANEKIQSLQAAIEKLEAHDNSYKHNMEWIIARRTRDLDNRATELENRFAWLYSWLCYLVDLCKMVQWQLSQPPVPPPPDAGTTPR